MNDKTTCPHCRVAFDPINSRQVYCCKRCNKNAHKKRARMRSNPPVYGKCLICEAEYTRSAKFAEPVTCGKRECVKAHKSNLRKAHQQNNRHLYKAWRKNNRAKQWSAMFGQPAEDYEQAKSVEREARKQRAKTAKAKTAWLAIRQKAKIEYYRMNALIRCCKCGSIASANRFPTKKRDGTSGLCAECKRIEGRAFYHKHKHTPEFKSKRRAASQKAWRKRREKRARRCCDVEGEMEV